MNTTPESDPMAAHHDHLPVPTAGAAESEPGAARKEVDPRMHSAEHLLTGTLMAMSECGRPFTTHLEKKKSKADYRHARALTTEEITRVEARVNEVVARDLAVREEFLPRSEAELRYDLTRVPDSAGRTIRIVHIGDYDACPCSGRHVSQTREIGRFEIISTTYEDGALRIRFRLREPAGAAK